MGCRDRQPRNRRRSLFFSQADAHAFVAEVARAAVRYFDALSKMLDQPGNTTSPHNQQKMTHPPRINHGSEAKCLEGAVGTSRHKPTAYVYQEIADV